MTPIDFGVIRVTVKGTGALNARMVSAYYFENYLLQSHISHINWSLLVDIPY
jgi:hypothetical protein